MFLWFHSIHSQQVDKYDYRFKIHNSMTTNADFLKNAKILIQTPLLQCICTASIKDTYLQNKECNKVCNFADQTMQLGINTHSASTMFCLIEHQIEPLCTIISFKQTKSKPIWNMLVSGCIPVFFGKSKINNVHLHAEKIR